ncbi:uncharacterized protein EDB91DRAFT_1147009 [Suillus paluster]|uniref:uncharacterized protein n=1 Tax=Suillus paluster TaxID=48578 RepID=UPI001B86440E|nr:uncharacterized protein EDB91DRAFT_1147009 [Suillus paluster]KAG1734208.1 hypothetical protein EDB91DRAFT_1147009 [Suillus paluster]
MSCTKSPSPAMSQVQVDSLPSESTDRSNLSLLSLSVAAASVSPISITQSADTAVQPSHVGTNFGHKHRRLSSTGKTRRRMSDARDAATRPSPASLQNAALSSLATLSLSSSPPSSNTQGTSLSAVSRSVLDTQGLDPIPGAQGDDATVQGGSFDDNELSTSIHTRNALGTNGGVTKGGKKRGTIFTCESCSKVYRHPSCLIKHRWEHTPQWREASKFVLSKHQQVQLLEAAAILSHLSPSSTTGTSLPEDRSLWPSFLSGGIVPPPAPGSAHEGSSPSSPSKPISSSVPATSVLGSAGRAGSTGPRLHDYSIPQATGPGGITQLRPGLLGVSTTPNSRAPSSPVPVPVAPATDADARNLLALGSASVHSESWDSPTSSSFYGVSSVPSASASLSRSGWSHPRSSVRSMSASSHSSDDGEPADVDDITSANMHMYGRVSGTRFRWKSEEEDAVLSFSVPEEVEEENVGPGVKKKSEEQWDGMEMDMEMD